MRDSPTWVQEPEGVDESEPTHADAIGGERPITAAARRSASMSLIRMTK